jgi:hypothetical protein
LMRWAPLQTSMWYLQAMTAAEAGRQAQSAKRKMICRDVAPL